MCYTALLTAATLSLGTPAFDRMVLVDRLSDEANSLAQEEIDIMGMYRCQGVNSDGNIYNGTVKIQKNRESYRLAWKIDGKESAVGVGIRKGHTLSVSSLARSSEGVSLIVVVYEIQAGPKLVGRYTEFGGKGILRTETLTIIKLPE